MAKRTLESQRKALECVKLRNAGLTFRDIALTMGISHVQVYKYVQKAVKEVTEELKLEAELLLTLEIERLDTIQRSIWNDVLKGNIPAVDKAIKIIELRMKAQGLFPPTKIANTDPTGQEQAKSGVVVVPATMSLDDWMEVYGDTENS